jgi:glucose/mannose transport system substrate-binding protein
MVASTACRQHPLAWQWLWLSRAAFEKAGVDVPTNWASSLPRRRQLEEAGIIPLAMGQQPWQSNLPSV